MFVSMPPKMRPVTRTSIGVGRRTCIARHASTSLLAASVSLTHQSKTNAKSPMLVCWQGLSPKDWVDWVVRVRVAEDGTKNKATSMREIPKTSTISPTVQTCARGERFATRYGSDWA